MAVTSDNIFTFIEQYRANSLNYGDEAIQKIFQYVDTSLNYANSAIFPRDGYTLEAIGIQDQQLPLTNAAIPEINDNLSVKYINDWLEKYRLIMEENFNNLLSFGLAEEHLQDILNNGYIVNKNIHNQIIGRTKDSEYKKSRQSRDEAIQRYTKRGFNNFSGYISKEFDRIDQQTNDNISQAIREIALKEEDLNTDMLKFAIENALRLKPQAVQIAADFASKYAQMYNFGAENARTYIQGLQLVQNSIANYERNKIDIFNSKSKRQLDVLNSFIDINKFDTQTVIEKAKLVLDTTSNAVDGLSRIASAALTAQTTIAQIASNQGGE